MKAVLALCFACVLPVSSQAATAKLQTGSRVPSLSIHFNEQSGGKYKFTIRNGTSHAVTALVVVFAPADAVRRHDYHACADRCSDSEQVGTAEHPVIAAGSSEKVSYEEARISGAVVIEAAVFDDGSYAGNERAATAMVAAQLGNQAEFDRITVEAVMTDDSDLQGASRGARLESAIAALPTEPDAEQTEAFYRWFPNVRDCNHVAQQIMQTASSQVKAGLQATMQGLASSNPATPSSVNNWWTSAKQYLVNFGCNECGTRLATPSPPVRVRTVSIGCGTTSSGQPTAPSNSPLLTQDGSSTADDSFGDAGSQSAANDDSSADASGQSDEDDALVLSEEANATVADKGPRGVNAVPAAPPPNLSTTAPVIPQLSPRQAESRCLPMAPRPMPGVRSRDGQDDSSPRPVLDELLYPRYFRYIAEYEKCFSDGQWPDETVARYPDPYPAALNDDQREIVATIAADWRESGFSAAVIRPPNSGVPLIPQRAETWAQAQEALQMRQARQQEHAGQQEERSKIVESRLQSLKLALGQKAFRALDDYAHDLYHAIPGRLLREPIPERAMYVRYLNYIALMDKFAANQGDDGHAAAKARADEQAACGLNDDDERVLEQEADSLHDRTDRMRPAGTFGRRVGEPSATAPPTDAEPASGTVEPLAQSLMEKLQARLSKASFEKVQKRMHALYGSETISRVVPADEPDTPNQAKTEDVMPRKN